MALPGLLCIGASFFLFYRLRDTPQSLGLPPIEKFRGDFTSNTPAVERELTLKEILFTYVLKNKYIWVLAASYFFVYVIRQSVNDWTAVFLVKEKAYSQLGAAATVSLFEVGGFLGGLVAGWSSDRIFGGRRGPINVIFMVAVLGALTLFVFLPENNQYATSFVIFLIGFAIFGPQMLIGVAAAELSHKKAAASSTGFVGCFAYLGAAFAGLPIGIIIRDFGWSTYYTVLGICAVMAVVILLPLWSIKVNPKH
jgi:OPA family sugar phosphate sensor protein UhpC-like MFS transporter